MCGRRILVRPGDLVIAADAGYKRLEEQGIKWDILVGDFDGGNTLTITVVEVIDHPLYKFLATLENVVVVVADDEADDGTINSAADRHGVVESFVILRSLR